MLLRQYNVKLGTQVKVVKSWLQSSNNLVISVKNTSCQDWDRSTRRRFDRTVRGRVDRTFRETRPGWDQSRPTSADNQDRPRRGQWSEQNAKMASFVIEFTQTNWWSVVWKYFAQNDAEWKDVHFLVVHLSGQHFRRHPVRISYNSVALFPLAAGALVAGRRKSFRSRVDRPRGAISAHNPR